MRGKAAACFVQSSYIRMDALSDLIVLSMIRLKKNFSSKFLCAPRDTKFRQIQNRFPYFLSTLILGPQNLHSAMSITPQYTFRAEIQICILVIILVLCQVDNDVSLILTKYSKVASEDAKVVWNYGCATCAPDLSTDVVLHAFVGNVNLTTGESLACQPLVDAYAGQIFDAQILDGCLQAWTADGQSPAFYLFCATYVDNKLFYSGAPSAKPGDTTGRDLFCPS